MFGISSTGYYNYVARKEEQRNGKLAAKRKDESYVTSCFKEIIKVLGLPGKRTFRRHMFRNFNYKNQCVQNIKDHEKDADYGTAS